MTRQLALGLKLSNHTRLEDFVGDAAARLQQLEGLVFLSGGRGTGKTHLLQGLCHHREDLSARHIYLSLASEASAPAMLQDLEHMQLVCLDDIDRVVGLGSWDEALFHLINGCRDQGATLVLASAVPVAGLTPSLPDLASRLKGAYLVSTDKLGDDEKLDVIRRKAARRGFSMSEDVCRFILGRSQRDMHHLAHLVDQLDEETLRQQKRVTIPFVKAALGL